MVPPIGKLGTNCVAPTFYREVVNRLVRIWGPDLLSSDEGSRPYAYPERGGS